MKDFGLKLAPRMVRNYDYDVCCQAVPENELPSKFELPIDEWAEVLDQLDVCACVSFAMVTAKEAHHYKTTGEHKLWAPGYIYGNDECRKGYMGTGMYMQKAIKGAMKTGFVPLLNFDIIREMPEMMSLVKERPELAEIGAKEQLAGFVELGSAMLSRQILNMKQAIYNYRTPLIVASKDYFGGPHAIILYGWDDDETIRGYSKTDETFKLRNSWGKKYKNGGNYVIPASQVDEAYLPLFKEIPFPFSDVKETDWFFKDVRNAVFSGLVNGTSETTFEPHNNMIRGDVAVIGARLLNRLVDSVNAFAKTLMQMDIDAQTVELRSAKESKTFIDIAPSEYYKGSVALMCANGILDGATDKTFEPKRPISRCEFATVVVRMYMYVVSLINTAIPDAKLALPSGAAKRFSDVSANEWYYNYVEKAQQFGLMQGDGDSFRPNDNISRAEATAVMNRLFKATDAALEKVRR